MTRFIDRVRAMIRGEAPIRRPPCSWDSALSRSRRGRRFSRWRPAHNTRTRWGRSTVCDLADAALGIAYASALEDNESFTTLLKINFLKPVWNARLRAEARIVKRGKTVGLVECDVKDETGSLVARASSTCLTLSGDKTVGR